MKIQTIGHNKINQLRHAMFFKNAQGVMAHMAKHAVLLKPKFDMVISILEKRLGGREIATWTNPQGGYFVSFNTLPGCAKKVVGMMKEAGVIMTEAGATYPYHNDPQDSNIRIAPSSASLDDLKMAVSMLTVAVKICSIDLLMEA